MIKYLTLFIVLIFSTPIFRQDFNSSPKIKDFVKSKPGKNYFDQIGATDPGTVEIVQGKLRLSKNGPAGQPFFVRNTDLDGDPQFISMAFKIKATGKGASFAELFFGDDLAADGKLDEVSKVYVRLGFNLSPEGFVIRNSNQGTNGTKTYEGEQSLLWYINKSGKTQTYTAPDGSSQTVDNNRWDLWVGHTKEVDEAGVTTKTQALTNFKMVLATSIGVIDLDDIEVNNLGN